MKTITLKNGAQVLFRLLVSTDSEALFLYLQNLSAESRSRFGPHAFDQPTIDHICTHHDTDDVMRYIALCNGNIIAYMLVKHGLIEWDSIRFTARSQYFDPITTATYAASVLDKWQNTGLGSAMFELILEDLKKRYFQQLILWGGVQATNDRAVHFYEKFGFKKFGSFWHDEKDNLDMLLEL